MDPKRKVMYRAPLMRQPSAATRAMSVCQMAYVTFRGSVGLFYRVQAVPTAAGTRVVPTNIAVSSFFRLCRRPFYSDQISQCHITKNRDFLSLQHTIMVARQSIAVAQLHGTIRKKRLTAEASSLSVSQVVQLYQV